MPKPRAPIPPGTVWGRWSYLGENTAATGYGRGTSRLVRVRAMCCGIERSAFVNNLRADKVACPCPRPAKRASTIEEPSDG